MKMQTAFENTRDPPILLSGRVRGVQILSETPSKYINIEIAVTTMQ